MVPGDDDQFSYVSAPASDYSVTTVGSDMLNNSRMSDEEERQEPVVTPPRRVCCSNAILGHLPPITYIRSYSPPPGFNSTPTLTRNTGGVTVLIPSNAL